MTRVLYSLTLLALVSLAPGCQLCRVTDCWNDRVDDIADYNPELDCLYNPRWDLTREYRPDGGHHWLFRRCGCDSRYCR